MTAGVPRAAVVTCLALVAAIAGIWSASLPYSFQFDDWNVIVDDARVQSVTAWWHSMPGIRPLLKLTYALNHMLAPSTAGFRSVNVALHAGNTLLVFWLATQAASRMRTDTSTTTASFVGALTAALFALHPVQSQAVTYLSGRSSSLVAIACLSSLALFIASLTHRARAAMLSAAMFIFAAALGVKESAIALPIVALLWLIVVERHSIRDVARAAAPYFWTAAATVGALLLTTSYIRLIELGSEGKNVVGNLLTQANGLTYLIGQCLLVRMPNPDPALAYVTELSWPVMLRGIAVLAIIALAWWTIRRRPVIAFGILWFFVWLAPTNSIAPRLDAVSDRQLYLAIIGPAWLVAWAIGALHHRRPFVAGAMAVAIVSTLATLTWRHNQIYRTEVTYWSYVSKQSPDNARAANNLGMAYAQQCANERALSAFDRALIIDPSESRARINRALLLRGELVAACQAHDPRAPD